MSKQLWLEMSLTRHRRHLAYQVVAAHQDAAVGGDEGRDVGHGVADVDCRGWGEGWGVGC